MRRLTPEEELDICADAMMDLDTDQFNLDLAKEWCYENNASASVWMVIADAQFRIRNTRKMTKLRARHIRQTIED